MPSSTADDRSALSSLVGRHDEVAALVDAIAHHRLVTVTGPGGVGKSRLVEEVVAGVDTMFDDGSQLVALDGVERSSDVAVLSGQFGKASPEAVAVSLGDGSSLLVLDGCEHVADAVAQFVTRVLATSDTVSVLITSREPLGVAGEHLVVLAPLALPSGTEDPRSSPAVNLFLERAVSAGSSWEPTDETIAVVVELCRAVDALPLAIELAAARARALSPLELLGLMDRRLEALRATARAQPGRRQSVRAALDISVELLDPTSRRAFARLGALAGPFDVGLARAVIDDRAVDPLPDPLATIDMLDSLVARSLVVAEPSSTTTRYRLLELLRDYAAGELRAAGEWEQTHERLVDAMVAIADDIVADGLRRWTGAVLSRIATHVGHLLGAIDWCIEHDPTPERAFRLFLPMVGAVHQSRSGEVRAAGERIFERWPDDPAPFRAESLAILATGCAMANDDGLARDLAERALADPSSTGVGLVLAHRALVLAALGRDDFDDARHHVTAGRAAAIAAQLAPFARELTGFEASLLGRANRPDDAIALAHRVVAESDEAHDPITEIWGRLVACNAAARRNDWPAVTAEVDQARLAASSAESSWWVATIFRSDALLTVYEAAARASTDGWDASQALWRAAIERAVTRGDLIELALATGAGRVVAGRVGRPDLTGVFLAATPPDHELAVLPDVFDDEPTAAPAPGVRTAALRALLAALTDAPGTGVTPDAPSPDRDATGELARDGDVWVVDFRSERVRVRDLKGIADLAVLLRQPGHEVHCLELMGAQQIGGAAGPVIDEQARRAYQTRILELQGDIDDAREAHDDGRAERAELELDAVVEQLSGAFGVGGRSRAGGSSSERARNAVTYRVRAAVKRIGEVHPELGRHLTNSIRTGTWCSYQPESPVHWTVDPG